MSVTDAKMHPLAKTGLKAIRLAFGTTATGQTAKVPDQVTVGFDFEIVKAEIHALTVTAVITGDVLIGSTSALAAAVAPVAATPTNMPLSSTLTARRGLATEILKAAYTSDGSGAATNGYITVWVRPIPGSGEARVV